MCGQQNGEWTRGDIQTAVAFLSTRVTPLDEDDGEN